MKTTKLLPGILLLACMLTYFSCKKIDDISPGERGNMNSIEEKFFNSHRTADPAEKGLIDFLKRVNIKNKFVEKTVQQIGYPVGIRL